MPAYRLYRYDGSGKRIEEAHWIAADNDVEAIQYARDKKFPTKCEVWDRARLVANIPAHQA